jgi:ribosome recycling factor
MRRLVYAAAQIERKLPVILGAQKSTLLKSDINIIASSSSHRIFNGENRSQFHSSSLCAAKSKKGGIGGKEKASNNDDAGADAIEVELPKLKDFDVAMEKKLARLVDEFSKLRSGQVNTEIFKNVMVDAHGARVPVSEAGQVSLKGPTKLSIAVYDPTLVSAVSSAIRDCGMSLNPTTEGNNVLVNIPKPSKETRDAVLKAASRVAEKVTEYCDSHPLFSNHTPVLYLIRLYRFFFV